MDVFAIAVVLLTFLLAGGVKGVVGFGLPTIALAVLSATLGIEAALPLMLIPSFVTNVWQGLSGGRALALSRRFAPALVLIPFGTWLGYTLVFAAAPHLMGRVLGGALIVYAVLGLRRVRPPVPTGAEPILTPALGFVNGIVTGITGTFVIPFVMYMEALGLTRDELSQMMGIVFSVSTLALAAVLVLHDAYRFEASVLSAAATAPALVGMALGARLRARLTPAGFRAWLFIALMLLGLKLLVTG